MFNSLQPCFSACPSSAALIAGTACACASPCPITACFGACVCHERPVLSTSTTTPFVITSSDESKQQRTLPFHPPDFSAACDSTHECYCFFCCQRLKLKIERSVLRNTILYGDLCTPAFVRRTGDPRHQKTVCTLMQHRVLYASLVHTAHRLSLISWNS